MAPELFFLQLWDVYVAELLCIGNLVAAAYLRAESESNIHVEGSPKSGGEKKEKMKLDNEYVRQTFPFRVC